MELFHGALTIIELPSRKKFDEQLVEYTADAYRCSPLKSDATVGADRVANCPMPFRPGDPGPIKYVLYIVKENRTYDQILGDLKTGQWRLETLPVSRRSFTEPPPVGARICVVG